MPDVSGYDLAPRMRAMTHGRPVVIAALTGWGQATDRERSAQAGFDYHVVKPASLAKIQSLLALVALPS